MGLREVYPLVIHEVWIVRPDYVFVVGFVHLLLMLSDLPVRQLVEVQVLIVNCIVLLIIV